MTETINITYFLQGCIHLVFYKIFMYEATTITYVTARNNKIFPIDPVWIYHLSWGNSGYMFVYHEG